MAVNRVNFPWWSSGPLHVRCERVEIQPSSFQSIMSPIKFREKPEAIVIRTIRTIEARIIAIYNVFAASAQSYFYIFYSLWNLYKITFLIKSVLILLQYIIEKTKNLFIYNRIFSYQNNYFTIDSIYVWIIIFMLKKLFIFKYNIFKIFILYKRTYKYIIKFKI